MDMTFSKNFKLSIENQKLMPVQANAEHDPQHQHKSSMPQTNKASKFGLDEELSAIAQRLGVKQKINPERATIRKKEREEASRKYQKEISQKQTLNNDEKLSMAKRLSTYTLLVGHLSDAYTTFVDVANQLYAETKAKKAADAALTTSLINIAMVWITPGVGKALEGLAVALEKSSKHAAFVAAYHLLDKKDKIASSLVGIPKDKIVKNVGTVKPGKDIYKNFIEGAKRGFVLTTSQLRKKLSGLIEQPKKLPDAELLAITAKWDPEILSASVLKARLKVQMDIWEKNVAPIGENQIIKGSNILEENKIVGRKAKGVVWAIQDSGLSHLCLVEAKVTRNNETPHYRFLRFIPENMKEMAIQKAEAQPNQAAGISHIPPEEIKDYPTTTPPQNTAKK